MEKQFVKALVERIDGKMVAVATDETVDRVGDSLKIELWDTKNYKRNPVLLWAHDYRQMPIGVAKNLRVEGRKMLFEPVFHEITEAARAVGQMFAEGIMSAFSVGFLQKVEYDKNGQEKQRAYELLEISAVPVPANPRALVLQRAFEDGQPSADEKAAVELWMKDFHDEPVEPPPSSVPPTPTTDDPEETKQSRVEVQAVMLSKEKFSQDDATKWVRENGFKVEKMDETDVAYRFTQFSTSKCSEGSERTIDLSTGISALVCVPKGAADGERACLIVPLEFIAQQASPKTVAVSQPSLQDEENKGRKARAAERRKLLRKQKKLLRRSLQLVVQELEAS